MTTLFLDFETYYSQDYSLSKMTTSSYIMDPQFKVHGASVGVYKNGTVVPKWLDAAQLQVFIDTLDWSTIALVGHNMMFDGLILAYRYNKIPKLYIDTLSMARFVFGATIKSRSLGAVHEKITGVAGKQFSKSLHDVKGVRDPNPQQMKALASYACDDLIETATIFTYMHPFFPREEYIRADDTMRMATQPTLRLNMDKLVEFRDKILDEKEELMARLEESGLPQSLVSSNKQFEAWLRSQGVGDDVLINERTNKVSLAKTNQKLAAFLTSDDIVLATAVEARFASKSLIKESRAKRFMDLHTRMNGWMPVFLGYCGAMQTNRFSAGGGENLNQQNLPRGEGLRSCIEAPKGYRVVAVDLSQIELRINMVQCGQTDVVDLLRKGEDVYCNFGSEFYGRTITKADKLERLVSKIAELSLGYGAGKGAFRGMLFAQAGQIKDLEFCDSVVKTYRKKRFMIKSAWAQLEDALIHMAGGFQPVVNLATPMTFTKDGIVSPSGFKIKYYNLIRDSATRELTYDRYDKGSSRSKVYSSVVIENISQCMAREVVIWDADQIRRQTGYRMAMQVHDELIYVVPERDADEFLKTCLSIMHVPPPFWPELPVAAEGGHGETYFDAK
jgi:hypothetical protein